MAHVSKLAARSAPLPTGFSHVTLLVGDRDSRTASTLRRSLANRAYTIHAANTLPKTLKKARENAPDAVILSADLCYANGAAVCREIRALNGPGFLPVLLVSEHAQDLGWEAEEPEDEPDAFLVKPIDPDEVIFWLRHLLRIKSQVDHRIYRLAHEARSIELLKADIIDSVSHELGTPLLQVKSALSLLAEDIEQHALHDQFRFANMATQAVARLEGVVNNIRQLAHAHNIALGPVALPAIAELAIHHLERSWTSRGARERIECRLADDLPVVLGDAAALAHLLQLLLDNALKFSPADAPVYVLAERISEDQVWIGVQDFGIGIPEEEHARIFEAFYQVNRSTTRAYGGTGTGLALAVLLANGMNTTIELQSNPGEGSIFSFVLPVAALAVPD